MSSPKMLPPNPKSLPTLPTLPTIPSPYPPPPSGAPLLYTLCDLTLSTWLLLGAALQSLLILLPIRPTYTILPAFLLLSYKIVDHLLIAPSLRRNRYLDGTCCTKFTARYPAGSEGEKKEKIAVVLLAARINQYVLSPLPLPSPQHPSRPRCTHSTPRGRQLTSAGERNGYLGQPSYHAVARPTSSEIVTVFYFTSLDACTSSHIARFI
jgi:hypothetical protein